VFVSKYAILVFKAMETEMAYFALNKLLLW